MSRRRCPRCTVPRAESQFFAERMDPETGQRRLLPTRECASCIADQQRAAHKAYRADLKIVR